MKDNPEDGTTSVIFMDQITKCTIDFVVANSTYLSKLWVASVSCGTSEIKIEISFE